MRRIDIPTNAVSDPSFHLKLTREDRMKGVVVAMNIGGKTRDVHLTGHMISLPELFGDPHRRADESGTLQYAVRTYRGHQDFVRDLATSFDCQLATIHGATSDQRIALAQVTWLSLPVWARDETAYKRKFGSQAQQYPFGDKPLATGGNDEFIMPRNAA